MPKIKYAWDCKPCDSCGEPWCDDCGEHYAECKCVGPYEECKYCKMTMEDCECLIRKMIGTK